jgi:hypothetical protein
MPKFLGMTNLARNREISRMSQAGRRRSEIARLFGLNAGYVGEIIKEMRRFEEWRNSPESLDSLSVHANSVLNAAAVRTISELEAFVSGHGWQSKLSENPRCTEKILAEVEKFAVLEKRLK